MKVELDRYRIPEFSPEGITVITRAEPFTFNSRAILIHRPRRAAIHGMKRGGTHMSVENHCGNGFSGSHLTFVDKVPDGRMVSLPSGSKIS